MEILSAYFKTLAKLCTKRYDACYLAITCHGKGFLKDAPFALLCKLFGNKIIIHQHNKGMSRDVDKPLFRHLFKAVYRNAKVILLSERLYPDISEIVERKQVSICPNGIPEVKRSVAKKNKIPRLLFLSNLIESKGVLVLLDACKILKGLGYDFTCDFIGGETVDIDSARFHNEVAVRKLSDIVHYLGRRYGDDKNQEIANCDIFVFPTSYPNECFPVVLLEAMQQGKPIVTTNIGGIPDIITENCGFTVIPDSPHEIAEKIAQLLDDEELRNRMGEASYEKYKQEFKLEDFENNIISILKDYC